MTVKEKKHNIYYLWDLINLKLSQRSDKKEDLYWNSTKKGCEVINAVGFKLNRIVGRQYYITKNKILSKSNMLSLMPFEMKIKALFNSVGLSCSVANIKSMPYYDYDILVDICGAFRLSQDELDEYIEDKCGHGALDVIYSNHGDEYCMDGDDYTNEVINRKVDILSKLKLLLKAKNITYKGAAKELGCCHQSVTSVMTGRKRFPDILEGICRMVGIDTDNLNDLEWYKQKEMVKC